MINRVSGFIFTPKLPWSLCAVRIIFFSGFCLSLWFVGDLFYSHATNCSEPWLPISYFKFFSRQICLTPGLADFFRRAWQASLLFSMIGFMTPWALRTCFLLSLFVVPYAYNFGKLHHISHVPVVIMGILAFSRCGEHLSVDAWIRRWRGFKNIATSSEHYGWPIQVAKIYIVLVYFEAGLQKLKNSGLRWFEAENMQILLLTRPTLTSAGAALAALPWAAQLSAFMIIFTQLGAPLALFRPRLAGIWIPGLALFHLGSAWLMGAHGNFSGYIWSLCVWLPINELVMARKNSAKACTGF